MKTLQDDTDLSKLSVWIAERMALHFPVERRHILEKNALSAATEFGYSTLGPFIQWLTGSVISREQMEILASHLTVGETYFWREPDTFSALEETILPAIIREKKNEDKRLRIWSAGCSSGEEAYSLAIAVRRALPDLKPWSVTIMATDMNVKALKKAYRGVYGKWSFRNTLSWLIENYFREADNGKLEIIPGIRRMVKFAYLNLATDHFPSPVNNTNAMDIIFCRNVLMYFTPENASRIVHGYYHSLTEHGWLMVSASELSLLDFSDFHPVNFQGTIVFRKGSPQKESTPVPVLERSGLFIRPVEESITQIPEIQIPAAKSLIWRETVLDVEQRQETTTRRSAERIRELANHGKLKEALAVCDEVIGQNKLDAGLYYLRAIILQELRMDEEAMASFKRALYSDPDFVMAHVNLGMLQLQKGNTMRAKRSFDHALLLLNGSHDTDSLPESDGLTIGRLKEIITSRLQIET